MKQTKKSLKVQNHKLSKQNYTMQDNIVTKKFEEWKKKLYYVFNDAVVSFKVVN